MSDDLVRRANMALDDIQGRVDASKLQVFEACIDLIEYLTEQLEAARLDAKEAEAYSVWLERSLAKAGKALEDASQILSQCTFTTIRVNGQYVDRREVVQDYRTIAAELKGDKT